MTIILKIFQGYRIALLHFFSIAQKSIFLMIYLCVAFISQVIYGLDYFDNTIIAIGYSLGTFIFISIAFTLTYYFTNKKLDNFEIKKLNIQLLIIGLVIIVHLVSVFGQFPDSYSLKSMTDPIRTTLHKQIWELGYSGKINAIIYNFIVCVILPLTLIFLVSKQKTGFYFKRINLKILLLLLLLYFPIILFGYKSYNEIISDIPYYLFIAAIPEEILYRGFLQSRLEKKLKNPVNAILISSLIFGFIHLPINIKMYGEVTGFATCIGNNAFGGLFLGYLFYRTRSIWTVIIFHLISGIALT
ncbi:MAG: CPBP family intramembrane glutamic endopeptidase [Candidatus Krumholzibacteriota bacterium]|nr:CPBP family intramembrane glutamic endopeptidase [Candidatus Krumholzibacteriota bacterium]